MPKEMLDVGILTPYAVEARYPGYWEEITEHEVDDAIQLAEKIVTWAYPRLFVSDCNFQVSDKPLACLGSMHKFKGV